MPNTTPQLPNTEFVPSTLDCQSWDQLQPLFDALLERPVDDLDALRQWLADYGALESAVRHELTTTHIDHACHTDDPAVEARFMHTVRNIEPKLAPIRDQLKRKVVASPASESLPEGWAVTLRNWRSGIELFREDNVALETACTELTTDYDKIVGEMIVNFRGESMTLQQLATHEPSTDRTTREQAWRLAAERRLQDQEPINTIYTKLVAHHQNIATNAGMANYRDYAMKKWQRFDYGTDECLQFHEAIKKICVPLVQQLDKEKQRALNLESLRPWDHSADPAGEPLKPFAADSAEDLMAKSIAVFEATEPWMGEHLSRLKQGRNLDLVSRKGKRAGGFQASLTGYGEPFIFMNAAGTATDVRTMLHEAGHAFHYQLAYANQPSIFLHGTGMEFAEVASMSMELLTLDHLQAFYPDEIDRKRAQRQQLISAIRLLPWITVIDAFQHAVHTNPQGGVEKWTQAWQRITSDFGTRHGGTHTDWSGLEDYKDTYWQRQLHLFHCPFYYIDYGIAQLGALQLWAQAKQNKNKAIAAYRRGLSLGNTKTLPELFAATGLSFDFSEKMLAPLIEQVQEALDERID